MASILEHVTLNQLTDDLKDAIIDVGGVVEEDVLPSDYPNIIREQLHTGPKVIMNGELYEGDGIVLTQKDNGYEVSANTSAVTTGRLSITQPVNKTIEAGTPMQEVLEVTFNDILSQVPSTKQVNDQISNIENQISNVNNRVDNVNSKIDNTNTNISTLNTRIDTLNDSIESQNGNFNAQIENVKSEIQSEIPKKISDLVDDSGLATKDELDVLKSSVNDANTNISALNTRIDTLNDSIESQNDDFNAQIENVRSEIPKKISDLVDSSDLATKVELDEYVTEDELSKKGYLTEHQDISGLATKDELDILKLSVDNISNSYISKDYVDLKLENTNNKIDNLASSLDNKIEIVKSKIDCFNNDLTDSKISIGDLGGRIDVTNNKIDAANIKIEDVEDRVDSLRLGLVDLNTSVDNKLTELSSKIDDIKIPQIDTSNLVTKGEFNTLNNTVNNISNTYASQEWVNKQIENVTGVNPEESLGAVIEDVRNLEASVGSINNEINTLKEKVNNIPLDNYATKDDLEKAKSELDVKFNGRLSTLETSVGDLETSTNNRLTQAEDALVNIVGVLETVKTELEENIPNRYYTKTEIDEIIEGLGGDEPSTPEVSVEEFEALKSQVETNKQSIVVLQDASETYLTQESASETYVTNTVLETQVRDIVNETITELPTIGENMTEEEVNDFWSNTSFG